MTAATAHQPPPEVGKTSEAVHDVVEHWWRIATVTRHAPAAHRRVLGRIGQTQTTDRPGTRTAAYLGRVRAERRR